MRKILVILVLIVMPLGLIACGSPSQDDTQEDFIQVTDDSDITALDGLWRCVAFDTVGMLLPSSEVIVSNDGGRETLYRLDGTQEEVTYTIEIHYVSFLRSDDSTYAMSYKMVDGGLFFSDDNGNTYYCVPYFDGIDRILTTENGVTTQDEHYSFTNGNTTVWYEYSAAEPDEINTFTYYDQVLTSDGAEWAITFTPTGYTASNDGGNIIYEHVRLLDGTWVCADNPDEYVTIENNGYTQVSSGAKTYGYLWSPDANHLVFQDSAMGNATEYELVITDADTITLTNQDGSVVYERR